MSHRTSLVATMFLLGCTGGAPGEPCHRDADCDDGVVCARDGLCARSSQVRELTVTWTVRGQAANAETCARFPELELTFYGSYGHELGFAPVPCMIGRFFIDKLQLDYAIAVLDGHDGNAQTRSIPASGQLAFELY